MRLGWGPPENDASSPHELDQDQLKRSRGRTSRAARALNERSRDLIESRSKPFLQRGLRWVFERR